MKRTQYAATLIMILLLSACGRRLDDDYFRRTTDFTPTVETVEVADAQPTQAETDSSADTETPAEATADADVPADDGNADQAPSAEVEMQLVEVPADPIVELVANASAENGEALFNSGVACSTCHRIDSEEMLVGPGFLGVPERAEHRVEGQVAERYMYNSITAPGDYIVEGFSNAMPPNYGDTYSDEEIYDLVAYLLTFGPYPEREVQYEEVAVPVESGATDADDMTSDAEATEAEAPETEVTAEAEAANADEVTTDETATEAATEVAAETDNAETEVPAATEAPTETEATVIVVTATPSTLEEAAPSEPHFELDLSAVPAAVADMGAFGDEQVGETVFTNSCSECHTIDGNLVENKVDLSYINQLENGADYFWAATFSPDVHPDLASQYSDDFSGSAMAAMIAYLQSFNETTQTDE